MNKKSNLMDFLTAGAIFLGLAIVIFVVYMILGGFADGMGSSDMVNTTGTNYSAFVDNSADKISSGTDWGILFLAIGFIIFSYIAASKIPASNKIIMLLLLFVFIFFIVAMVISNMFGGLMTKPEFSNVINLNMPITKILLQYFPFYALIYDFVVLVGFFGKRDLA